MSYSTQKPDCGSYQILTYCRDKNTKQNMVHMLHFFQIKKNFYVSDCRGHTDTDLYNDVSDEWTHATYASVYLLMVKGCRAGCCLGMQMILGELRLGLPSPELPILLVLPLIPIPWPTWEWFSMFLVFIGNVPLLKYCQVWFSWIFLNFPHLMSNAISISRYLML